MFNVESRKCIVISKALFRSIYSSAEGVWPLLAFQRYSLLWAFSVISVHQYSINMLIILVTAGLTGYKQRDTLLVDFA